MFRSSTSVSNFTTPLEILRTIGEPPSGCSMVSVIPSVSPVTLVTGQRVPSISTAKPCVRNDSLKVSSATVHLRTWGACLPGGSGLGRRRAALLLSHDDDDRLGWLDRI